jgi:hypothetical protein
MNTLKTGEVSWVTRSPFVIAECSKVFQREHDVPDNASNVSDLTIKSAVDQVILRLGTGIGVLRIPISCGPFVELASCQILKYTSTQRDIPVHQESLQSAFEGRDCNGVADYP